MIDDTVPHRKCKTPDACRRECICLDGWHCAHGDHTAEIDRIFRELAAKQEPLGKEFEDVLTENLWNLYGR